MLILNKTRPARSIPPSTYVEWRHLLSIASSHQRLLRPRGQNNRNSLITKQTSIRLRLDCWGLITAQVDFRLAASRLALEEEPAAALTIYFGWTWLKTYWEVSRSRSPLHKSAQLPFVIWFALPDWEPSGPPLESPSSEQKKIHFRMGAKIKLKKKKRKLPSQSIRGRRSRAPIPSVLSHSAGR